MKKLLFVILVAIACTGCTKSENEFIAEIKNKFPNSEIRKIPNPNHSNQWLVKTSDDKIIYVYINSMFDLVDYSMF